MAATVTLTTTTVGADEVLAGDTSLTLASLTGIVRGICLYIDRELLSVTSLGIGLNVNVVRGVSGTFATGHGSGATATIGLPTQFYVTDPEGWPPDAVPVLPYINVLTGVSWTVTGSGSSRVWTRSGQTSTGAVLASPTLTTPVITSPVITNPVATFTADDAIPVTPGVNLIGKTSAAAMTIAAPGTGGIGQLLYFTTITDFAHVVTFTGSTLWDGTSGSNSTWTSAAVQGSSLTIVGVSSTKWNVVSFNLGTIAP